MDIDVLEQIENLRSRLWVEYGDVLQRPYTQNEKHMTYYVRKLLEEIRMSHDENYNYSEKAMQAAFIAGMRVGQKDTLKLNKEIRSELIDVLIDELEARK